MVGRQPPSASTVEMVKVGVNVVIVILDADFTYTAAAVDTLLVANVAERLEESACESVWWRHTHGVITKRLNVYEDAYGHI